MKSVGFLNNFLVSLLLLSFIFCELPPYPAPKTEIGIVVSSFDGSMLIKDGVFYDTIGKEIRVGFNLTYAHRVDSFYFRIMSPSGEMILDKRLHKVNGDIVIKDTSKGSDKRMEWDTLLRLGCSGDYDVYGRVFLDNATEKEVHQRVMIISRGLDLDGLSLEGVEIEPSFSGNVYKYKAVVENEVSSIKIVPLLLAECGLITIDGDTVNSGIGKEIGLLVGKNVVEVKTKVSENEKLYEVEVVRRERRDEVGLKFVRINGEEIVGDSVYYVKIGSEVDSVRIEVESRNDKAVLTMDSIVERGKIEIVKQLGGRVNEFSLKVLSEDGNRKGIYFLTIERELSKEIRLKELRIEPIEKIVPEFNEDRKEYEVVVSDSIDSVEIFGEPLNKRAKVELEGKDLPQKVYIERGSERKLLKIDVIAEDSSVRGEYRLYFTKNREGDSSYVLAAIVGSGRGRVDVPQRIYKRGSEVKVRAIPDSGYVFKEWVGDVIEEDRRDSTISIVMDKNKSISAIFVKVNEVVALDVGEMNIHGSIYVDGYYYLSTRTNPAKILKVNVNNISDYKTITFPEGYSDADQIVYSFETHQLYTFFLHPSKVIIAEIDPITLYYKDKIVDTLHYTFNMTWAGPTIATDNYSIYLNIFPPINRVKIAKYSITNSNFLPDTTILPEQYKQAHSLRVVGNELIVVGGNNPMWIVKLDKENLTLKDSSTFDGTNCSTDDFGVSDKYYFVGTETRSPSSTAGNIYRVSKSDLGKVVTINTGVTEGSCYGVQEALGYIWAVYGTSPGILVRIDPVSMEVKKYQLEYNLPNEIVSDGKRLLITYWEQDPGIIQSFDLEYLKGREIQ